MTEITDIVDSCDAELLAAIAGNDDEPVSGSKESPIPLSGHTKLIRKPTSRLFFDATKAKCAADALGGLPAVGETWHCLMSGDFDSFDLIDAIIALNNHCKIDELWLATLGFNHVNAVRLCQLLDNQSVATCRMIVSAYYYADKKEKAVCAMLSSELDRHGGWFVATRSHAKIMAVAFADGTRFTIESSANMRSCRCIEQFTITNSSPLYAFHTGWMGRVYETERSQ